jgi:hypothetical protein
MILTFLGPLPFHINVRMRLFLQKKVSGILIGIVAQRQFRENQHLYYVDFLMHKHGLSLSV